MGPWLSTSHKRKLERTQFKSAWIISGNVRFKLNSIILQEAGLVKTTERQETAGYDRRTQLNDEDVRR